MATLQGSQSPWTGGKRRKCNGNIVTKITACQITGHGFNRGTQVSDPAEHWPEADGSDTSCCAPTTRDLGASKTSFTRLLWGRSRRLFRLCLPPVERIYKTHKLGVRLSPKIVRATVQIRSISFERGSLLLAYRFISILCQAVPANGAMRGPP